MRRTLLLTIALALIAAPIVGQAQIYPPKPGVEMPQAYFDRLETNKDAFRFKRAWIHKVQRIKENREKYVAEKGFYHRQLLAPGEKAAFAVTGTVQVPVFMVKYANTGADPYATSVMQTKLFDGPFAPQTLTEYYAEISYGDLNMTGTVYGWTTLPNNDTYYEGGCQGLCGSAQVDELIKSALSANDGAVDFGIYDNDGPDGLPNSGDDDGYVDFAAFVHPESGGECGTPNIWSHRWYLEGWGSGGWTSNDPAAGGGFIKVSDYVIQPALNCGGATVIDIGVFCHEFGHALSLPDLYDTNGGSQGIGHWGLMGSGSWNSVTEPAHMCAWAKSELGWANLVDVEGKKGPYSIDQIEDNRTVYRLGVMEERWRRMTDCAIGGSYSMRCGLTAAEAAARSWVSGEGYGDGWRESVQRDFEYDGVGNVTLEFDYDYSSEVGYDYTYLRIDVGGTVSTLATYNGTNGAPAHAVIDLTPYLSPGPYTVLFQFESDLAWSDEDGQNATTCGSFVFDNVSVNGGGEAHFTDFEVREDGWYVDMSEPTESFFVENRQQWGSDINLHNPGLNIWHIDQSVTRGAGNSGGSSGNLPHGVALEEADNLGHLASGANRGDGGDPYPGSSNNMLFDDATSPNSISYNGNVTNACVELTSGSGDPMTANMSGGWFPPGYASHVPSSGDNNEVVVVTIQGSGFAHDMGAELEFAANKIFPNGAVWYGKDLVEFTFDLSGYPGGVYDLNLINPVNSCTVVAAAFTVNDVVSSADSPTAPNAYRLGQNYPNPFNPQTVIPFDIRDNVHTTLKIYNIRGQVVRTLVDGPLEARSYAIPWNGRNELGVAVSSGVYFYKLVAGDFQDVRKLLLMK